VVVLKGGKMPTSTSSSEIVNIMKKKASIDSGMLT
jgi:hypothetical protein